MQTHQQAILAAQESDDPSCARLRPVATAWYVARRTALKQPLVPTNKQVQVQELPIMGSPTTPLYTKAQGSSLIKLI